MIYRSIIIITIIELCWAAPVSETDNEERTYSVRTVTKNQNKSKKYISSSLYPEALNNEIQYKG